MSKSSEVAVIEKKEVVKKTGKAQTGTPEALIRFALEKGSDLTKLEQLLTIQERWEANEAKKAYHKAMAAFKASPPRIKKDKKVGYDSKAGGRVGYSHASLGNVTESISSELSKYGLSAGWTTKQENGNISVTCKVTHELGHSEETTLSAKADETGAKNSIQAIGSTVTYLERYTLLALTGLATFDQDDDGQATITEFVDDKELNYIVDMIAEVGINVPSFLKYMGAEALEKIKKSDYQKAVNAIEQKKMAKK